MNLALQAVVDKPGVYRVLLERYPEGVYVLVYNRPDTERPARDNLQDDWDMAKRACWLDYGIADDM